MIRLNKMKSKARAKAYLKNDNIKVNLCILDLTY